MQFLLATLLGQRSTELKRAENFTRGNAFTLILRRLSILRET